MAGFVDVYFLLHKQFNVVISVLHKALFDKTKSVISSKNLCICWGQIFLS